MPDIDPLYVFYAAAALAAILGGEALYLIFAKGKSYRSGVNRRLDMSAKEPDREKVLVQLRRERGLTAEGGYAMRIAALNRLILQSGIKVDLTRAALVCGLLFVVLSVGVFLWRGSVALSLVAGIVGAVVLPHGALLQLRKRRQKAFGEKFPEAIDVIVRSLRAGHPVPVAITMVGRELPDPVGTEFGLAADEITYGSDLDAAMRNMMDRVGQEDLPLFVTSVAIQSTTGGNLSQILDNLAKVIRERFKMRRKVRGLSAEGRAGAMILNITPMAVFALINVMNPNFYGDIWHEPLTKLVLGGALFWMFIGNLIMRRMINFEI